MSWQGGGPEVGAGRAPAPRSPGSVWALRLVPPPQAPEAGPRDTSAAIRAPSETAHLQIALPLPTHLRLESALTPPSRHPIATPSRTGLLGAPSLASGDGGRPTLHPSLLGASRGGPDRRSVN